MRAVLWFVLGLALDALALDMLVWYADAQALYVLAPMAIVCLGMAMAKAEEQIQRTGQWNVSW